MVSIALLPHQEWARLSVIQQALPEYYSAYYIINTEGTLSGKISTHKEGPEGHESNWAH